MKTLGIKTHKMKNVYTGNHFFLLSKDLNAGKPLNKPCPNCFVPFADCDEEKYHFCKKYVKKFGKKVSSISKPVITALTQYDWPGNVGELENIIERGLIVSQSEVLEAEDWLPKIQEPIHQQTQLKESSSAQNDVTLESRERQHILEVLTKTNWKIRGANGAAKILEINPTTLEARMKKLGLAKLK